MAHHLRIAIAGAGIGGLAAAALLGDQGHDVTIYDRFNTPAPVGSGLVIQPVGQAVLDEIGAGARVREMGNAITRMLGHEADSTRRVLDVWYDRTGGQNEGIAIHRASLFQALLEAAQARGITLVPSHKVTKALDGVLHFSDGQSAGGYDLIIDATGANSPLSPLVSKPLAYGAVWGTVDWKDGIFEQGNLRQTYRKAEQMMGVLPCGVVPGESTQKAAIFWSLPVRDYADWEGNGLHAWKENCRALWPDAMPFFDQIAEQNQMTMARYSHGTLAKPYSEKLAIIGDAAHRASPQLGQGANMALLDALALSEALKVAEGQEALALYAQARRWHVRIYQGMSWVFTPQYQSDSRVLPWLRDRLLFPVSQIPPLPRLLTAIVCGTMIRPLGRLTRP